MYACAFAGLVASLAVSCTMLGMASDAAVFDKGAPLLLIWHRCNIGILASMVGLGCMSLCIRHSKTCNWLIGILIGGYVLVVLWGWAIMYLIAELDDTIYVLTPVSCGLSTLSIVFVIVGHLMETYLHITEPAPQEQQQQQAHLDVPV